MGSKLSVVMPAHSRPKDGVLRTPMARASTSSGRRIAKDVDGPPCSQFHAIMMCRSCPRTPIGDVPGLYNKPGHDALSYRAALSGWVAKREARNAVTKRGMVWSKSPGP